MKVKALHGIALAALLGFSSAASATVYNWTALSTIGPDASLTGSFSYDSVANSYSNINLTYTPNAGSATNFNSFFTSGSNLASTNLATPLTLFIIPESNVTTSTGSNPDYLGWAVSADANAIPDAATHSTTFSVVAAPVPEPETYAMFLAGLGLLGFARRAKKA